METLIHNTDLQTNLGQYILKHALKHFMMHNAITEINLYSTSIWSIWGQHLPVGIFGKL